MGRWMVQVFLSASELCRPVEGPVHHLSSASPLLFMAASFVLPHERKISPGGDALNNSRSIRSRHWSASNRAQSQGSCQRADPANKGSL